jgi:hypothetical protein
LSWTTYIATTTTSASSSKFHALNCSHQHIFTSYSHGHSFEEEHNVHDEPYGYELGDDPFEPQGQSDYPYLLIFVAGVAFTTFAHSHFKFDRRKVGEVLYHQRLTAF